MLVSTGVAVAGVWTYQRRTLSSPTASGLGVERIRSDVGARQETLVAGPAPIQRTEPAPAEPGSTGTLYVETDPPHLPVLVDDVERGVTPLTVEGLEPGDHRVRLGDGADALPRIVSVSPSERVTLIVVFRHPQLGQRRESIVVHSGQPAHLAVDMRQK